MNNRPLLYVKDDAEMPILTPNAMQFGQPTQIAEEVSRIRTFVSQQNICENAKMQCGPDGRMNISRH